MQEIRFNQPPSVETSVLPSKPEKRTAKSVFNFFKLLSKVILVLAILYGAIVGSKYLFALMDKGNPNTYSAVFLTNGQVYFGKMTENKKDIIVLKDVYYLQSASDSLSSAGSQISSQFTLVKLGNELHGPKDELFINKSQVMFYEYLKEDSKVVESITKNKN